MLVKIISTILRNTYTNDDLISRLAVMRKFYATVLYGSTFSGRMNDLSLSDVIPESLDDHILRAVTEWRDTFARDGIQPLVVYEALDAVEEEITGLPSATLYLPIRFEQKHIELFGKWFRSNVQPNIMLNIRVDPATAGGCALVWNSVYYDFSFKYFVMKQREQIVKVFDSVS